MATYPLDAPTPSFGISSQKSYRVLSADFGDGYSQRTGDGLNTEIETLSMVWDVITESEKTILTDFFDETGGYLSFLYTAYGEAVAKKWIVKNPVVTPINGVYFKVTATFERVYDL